MLTCGACDHSNAPNRGYCGACGHMLRPVCRGCRFANEHGDRFCGGCGCSLTARPAFATTAKIPAAASATSDALDALFEVKATPLDDILPAAGISQDDLDRLFGARGVR